MENMARTLVRHPELRIPSNMPRDDSPDPLSMYAFLTLADKHKHQSLEPKTYREATTSHDKVKWRLSMEDEYNSLMENNTWSLGLLPPGRRVLRGRWV